MAGSATRPADYGVPKGPALASVVGGHGVVVGGKGGQDFAADGVVIKRNGNQGVLGFASGVASDLGLPVDDDQHFVLGGAVWLDPWTRAVMVISAFGWWRASPRCPYCSA